MQSCSVYIRNIFNVSPHSASVPKLEYVQVFFSGVSILILIRQKKNIVNEASKLNQRFLQFFELNNEALRKYIIENLSFILLI